MPAAVSGAMNRGALWGGMVTISDIRQAARDLGLSCSAVCVHASLRSFGRVEAGAAAIIDGLLAEGCTVMVATFSYEFSVPPPPGMRPPRNGWDYAECNDRANRIDRVYTPQTNEVDREMGAVASAVLNRSSRVRGDHPLNSFAAVGPFAHHLIATQAPLNVYAPLAALAEAEGLVVLMGVPLTRLTLLHLAEKMAGRNPFRRWANGPDGQPMEMEAGGCSAGFGKFEPMLSPLMRSRQVGHSL